MPKTLNLVGGLSALILLSACGPSSGTAGATARGSSSAPVAQTDASYAADPMPVPEDEKQSERPTSPEAYDLHIQTLEELDCPTDRLSTARLDNWLGGGGDASPVAAAQRLAAELRPDSAQGDPQEGRWTRKPGAKAQAAQYGGNAFVYHDRGRGEPQVRYTLERNDDGTWTTIGAVTCGD